MPNPKPKATRTEPPMALNATPTPTRKPRTARRSVAPPIPVTVVSPPTPASKRPTIETTPAAAPPGKQAQVLALLHRPAGATIAEMMVATGWMAHSVRGLLSAGIKRKLGLMVTSTVEPERGRIYRIGQPAPLIPPTAPLQDSAVAGTAGRGTKTVRRRRITREAASGSSTDTDRISDTAG